MSVCVSVCVCKGEKERWSFKRRARRRCENTQILPCDIFIDYLWQSL